MRRLCAQIVAIATCVTALVPLEPTALPAVPASRERVWAIGDLHGDATCARHWVQQTQLVNDITAPPDKWVWMDSSSQLVFMGDYIDRGPDARAVLEFVRELTVRFPAHVHALLGNHEYNLLIDRSRQPGVGQRYLEYAYAAAHPAQYTAWLASADDDAASVLRALDEALLAIYRDRRHPYASGDVMMLPEGPRSIANWVDPPAARERVTAALRGWQAAYMRGVSPRSRRGTCIHTHTHAYARSYIHTCMHAHTHTHAHMQVSPRSRLGSWVQRPLTVHLADTIFVHGGLSMGLTL